MHKPSYVNQTNNLSPAIVITIFSCHDPEQMIIGKAPLWLRVNQLKLLMDTASNASSPRCRKQGQHKKNSSDSRVKI